MLSMFLRLAAFVFILVSMLHLVLGLNADVMIGAKVPPNVISDPVLDSQNRFYGVAFSIYGVLLAIGASDLKRHALMLQCCLWCFFAGGVARIVSIAVNGTPSPAVLALLALELVLPPLLSLQLHREARDS